MIADEIKMKYIGGPTILLEAGGLQFLTDPTFDDKDTLYNTGLYTLHKKAAPKLKPEDLGNIDFVLLSHDHHFDNLDKSGRHLLSLVPNVYTTLPGAERLGGNAVGIQNWQTFEEPTKDNRVLTITGTPCRHGPAGGDRGPVTGFVLKFKNEEGCVYISGDTVWYEGVEEVSRRFDIKLVFLFMGAAVVKEVGSDHLTMTAKEALQVAEHFNNAQIVPLHYEGWEHFTESHTEIESTFKTAGYLKRLRWPD